MDAVRYTREDIQNIITGIEDLDETNTLFFFKKCKCYLSEIGKILVGKLCQFTGTLPNFLSFIDPEAVFRKRINDLCVLAKKVSAICFSHRCSIY